MILMGALGFVFVGSELMVLTQGAYLGQLSLGRQFHRLEQIAAAWFLVALPILVGQILLLPPLLNRVNRALILVGLGVSLAVTLAAFVVPDIYVSQSHPYAPAVLSPGDIARGRVGWLYQARDLSVGILMIYSIALMLLYLPRQSQLQYRLPVLVALVVAFWAAVDDILFGYFHIHIDPLPYSDFSRFSIGASLVVFASMLSAQLRFLQQGRELKQANSALDKLLNAAEEKLYRDPLTGFPNRVSLMRDLEEPGEHHLILGNLNRFGDTNDFYGIAVGDILLRSLSRRLEHFSREHNLRLYKFRGDEFALLVPGECDRAATESLAANLHRAVTQSPYRYDEHRIELELALGVGLGSDRVLEKAESALFQAKKMRKPFATSDSVLGFDRDFNANLRRAKQIRDAIRNERVKVWYQPIHDNQLGVIAKYEALVRLQELDGSILYPAEFLNTARRTNLYGGVSREVIRQVFHKLNETPREISLNLTAEDLGDSETLSRIYRGLEKEGAERLVFEIVESESMGDYGAVGDFIGRVKSRGCRIAIDDFGTGYSTFQHLLRLKADFIKIDGSLIKNLDSDENSRILVGNIVDFSKKLGMLTVAEYVHSERVQAAVLALGVNFSQGYFFGAPKQELV